MPIVRVLDLGDLADLRTVWRRENDPVACAISVDRVTEADAPMRYEQGAAQSKKEVSGEDDRPSCDSDDDERSRLSAAGSKRCQCWAVVDGGPLGAG